MDFDTLPETVFLRIFDYLPLTDRFRVGRVSQSFNRISQIVNGRIKSLNLDDPIFTKLDENQFEVILCLCQHNLHELTFSGTNSGRYLAAKFSEFVCPQLVALDLDCAAITDDEFASIITNHPNLKSLKWWSMNEHDEDCFDDVPTLFHVQFPPVTLPHLETLHIQDLSDASLERLIDRCPNLKKLEMTLDQASSEYIWDRFFRSVPRLESLQLEMFKCPILMENLEWFWRLPLTYLFIGYHRAIDELMITDKFVEKLIENFANVEHLRLDLTEASEYAIGALTRLEKLRVIELRLPDADFIDEAIREFSACRYLEELSVYSSPITEQTFLDLFRNCPRLHTLSIRWVVDDEDGPVGAFTACVLLSELTNIMPHRPIITIDIRGASYTYQVVLELHSVWKSIQVQNAVQHLKQSHGIEIFINLPCMPPPPPTVDEMVQDDAKAEDGDDEAMDVGGQLDD